MRQRVRHDSDKDVVDRCYYCDKEERTDRTDQTRPDQAGQQTDTRFQSGQRASERTDVC